MQKNSSNKVQPFVSVAEAVRLNNLKKRKEAVNTTEKPDEGK